MKYSYLPDINKFFICFKDRGERLKLSDVLPNVCPFLLHSCIPYIFVFSNNGKFPWMEFTQWPDAVFVQCANPNDGIEVRLYKEKGEIYAIINQEKGSCPYGYKVGDTISLTPDKDIKLPLEVYYNIFPWLTYLYRVEDKKNLSSPELSILYKDRIMEFYLEYRVNNNTTKRIAQTLCTILEIKQELNLNLVSFTYRCRYHKWPKRERYTQNNLSPKGLCPDLFYTAYIYCLCALYSKKDKPDTFIVKCPNPQANIWIKIVTKKMSTYYLRRLITLLLSKLKVNKEIPDSNCYLILERTEGDCAMNMKEGTKFVFNLWRKYELCPATLSNIYFGIHNSVRGVKVPWEPGKKGSLLQCPDPASNITFNLELKGYMQDES